MDNIPHNIKQAFPFKEGEPIDVGGNRPMKFRIDLIDGGYVEGIIPANEKLTICSCGQSMSNIDITIDEDSTKPIQAV